MIRVFRNHINKILFKSIHISFNSSIGKSNEILPIFHQSIEDTKKNIANVPMLPHLRQNRQDGMTYRTRFGNLSIWKNNQLFCIHGINRRGCMICLGECGIVCSHGKRKIYCLECDGRAKCKHGIVQRSCRLCSGLSYCVHNRIKYVCIVCNGSKLCEHKVLRRQCTQCSQVNIKGINTHQRVRTALLAKKNVHRHVKYLGCTPIQLRKHFEKLFDNDMHWDNYGLQGWSIDYIKPLSKFNFVSESDMMKCFHYTNLQPMWLIQNRSKRDKFIESEFKRVWDDEKGWVDIE